MSVVVGNPVVIELPLFESGAALTGKASVLNALTGDGITYCRHRTPSGTFSTVIPSGTWAEDGTTGVYRLTVTATGVEGFYTASVLYTEAGHPSQSFMWSEQVETAAQADPLSASVADYAGGTAGGRIRLITAGSRS